MWLVACSAEYVDLVVDFLLNKSIATQFGAFFRGFMNVADGPALKMFRAEELEQLVVGSKARCVCVLLGLVVGGFSVADGGRNLIFLRWRLPHDTRSRMDLLIQSFDSSGILFTVSRRWGCFLVFPSSVVDIMVPPQDEKKQLLSFCTGSHRAPIRGLGALRLIIGRQGPDSEQ